VTELEDVLKNQPQRCSKPDFTPAGRQKLYLWHHGSYLKQMLSLCYYQLHLDVTLPAKIRPYNGSLLIQLVV
jgi:hypothetical protein